MKISKNSGYIAQKDLVVPFKAMCFKICWFTSDQKHVLHCHQFQILNRDEIITWEAYFREFAVGLPWWLRRFHPWVRKISWSRKWQPSVLYLPWEFHGQRSLAGYIPWGCKELDKTEWLILSCTFKLIDKKGQFLHTYLNEVLFLTSI